MATTHGSIFVADFEILHPAVVQKRLCIATDSYCQLHKSVGVAGQQPYARSNRSDALLQPPASDAQARPLPPLHGGAPTMHGSARDPRPTNNALMESDWYIPPHCSWLRLLPAPAANIPRDDCPGQDDGFRFQLPVFIAETGRLHAIMSKEAI